MVRQKEHKVRGVSAKKKAPAKKVAKKAPANKVVKKAPAKKVAAEPSMRRSSAAKKGVEEAFPSKAAIKKEAAIKSTKAAAAKKIAAKTPAAKKAAATHSHIPAYKPAPVQTAAMCNHCGRVVEVRQTRIQGEGSGVGAVAGGMIGAAAEEGITRSQGVEITVREDDGQTRAYVQEADPAVSFFAGERVRILTVNGVSRVSK